MNLKIVTCIAAAFIATSLSAQKGLGVDDPEKPDVCKFVINTSQKQQTIDNFSASDGWSMQFIGLWPQEKSAQIADWLFSTENDAQGKPKGIGLSLWRFNIGTGSAEQGDSSGIHNVWTRSECFLNAEGIYDWSKQKGQRHFLQLAKERGVDQYLGFILSAPVYWTQNGMATNLGRGADFNIQPDRYDDFARFLADVTQGLEKNDGIKLNYLCPFNEPDGHWNWTGHGQEGTAATNKEMARTARELGQELNKRGMDTQILLSESFDYSCMYRMHPYVKADRGYQIQSFFTPDSASTYVGNVPNVPKLMVGHSYWTNTPIDSLRKIRQDLGAELKKHHLKFWQTELCIMSNDAEIGYGGGKDLSMKTALYIARVIHNDLVYANASAWQWWRSVATGDYKDGLVYTTPDATSLDGTLEDSKLMWILGNYSRFIRPGAVRLGISAYNSSKQLVADGDTDEYALLISAYENRDKTPVVVAINYSNTDREFDLNIKGKKPNHWQPYITSDKEGNDLAPELPVSYGKKITIPARSVVTYVGKK